MADDLASRFRHLLEGVPASDSEQAVRIIAGCPMVDIEGAARRFRSAFGGAALLLILEGFVVLRATVANGGRSVVTCEAGSGKLILPPSAHEELIALGRARVCVIDADGRRRLLQVAAVAERIVDSLAFALGEEQEATANFALTHHVERVRRKLLQLARGYGHVVGDGVRIDFPVSHALLAEMIGSSRETVTRAVDTLQRAGFVARHGSSYRLLVSPASLFEPALP